MSGSRWGIAAPGGYVLFFDGAGRHEVRPGALIFVAAGRPHRFEQMSDDFAVWVFFYGPVGGEAAGASA